MVTKRKKIGELLIEKNLVTESQIKEALNYQKKKGVPIGEALVELGYISSDVLVEVLSIQLDIPYVNLYKYPIDESLIGKIDGDLAKRFSVFPIKERDGKLILAMKDPLDVIAMDEVARTTGMEVEPVITTKPEIQRVLDQHYGITDKVSNVITKLEKNIDLEREALELNKLKEMVDDAPIVRIVNSIIERAINEGASDIHIEPSAQRLMIRFRIDGVLHDIMNSPKNTQSIIISRLKIMANMDIAERRLPQDSRFQTSVSGKEVDIRVSTLPTIYGEKMVLRILDKSALILDIEDLGMEKYNLLKFKDVLSKPNGILLLTGPTGCGKTTTLYSILNYLNSRDKNILTIEDPVEYRLDGINQVNVIPKIGLNFAEGLRSILRQDPDVIMVGEIRDQETAEIAIRAAMTVHVVLSTLHTNDAPGALNRFIDMGLPPFLVASAVNGVLAQRLVRKICTVCHGEGCAKCSNTGYKGRIAIHEMLTVDDDIRRALMEKISNKDLKRLSMEKGLVTLYKDGLEKIKKKITTHDELLRVTYEEDF